MFSLLILLLSRSLASAAAVVIPIKWLLTTCTCVLTCVMQLRVWIDSIADTTNVLVLRQGDKITRGRAVFGVLFPHWQCIVQHSIWDLYKNGWADRDAVWGDEWAWPEEQCVTWGRRSRRGMGNFGDNVPDKPNTPVNCKLDWSMQRRAHNRDRCLIASIGRVYYRLRRVDCTPWAKSDVADCLVANVKMFLFVIVRYQYLMLTYVVLPYQEWWAWKVSRYDVDDVFMGIFQACLPMLLTVYDYFIISDVIMKYTSDDLLLWFMTHRCFFVKHGQIYGRVLKVEDWLMAAIQLWFFWNPYEM